MPTERFEDHVEVVRIDAAALTYRLRGKTWQGRDFIRTHEAYMDVNDYDGDPWIIHTLPQAASRAFNHGQQGYLSSKQPQTKRNYR